MRVIQLSDLHLRGDGQLSYQVADTPFFMNECVSHIESLSWKPDAIVITGDLADSGSDDAYKLLRNFLDRLPAPVFVLPGNHDKRAGILTHLNPYCPAEEGIAPYLCYTKEDLAMRLIVVDATHPGSHSGHLDPPVADWLEARLAERPTTPTLLFTHHLPFLTSFGAMDEPYENAARFGEILSCYPNVRLCCGHIHRPIVTQFGGCIAVTCPSTAMQIEVDMRPEGGDEFRMEAAGYLLHHWYNGVCNTHVCQIPGTPSFSGPHRFVNPVNPT